MIFSEQHGVAKGIERTVNTAILLTVSIPGPILAALTDGKEKALIFHYYGELAGKSFDPQRGDAQVSLRTPEHEDYRRPPSYDARLGHEIRSGVPLWLVRPAPDGVIVLGIGRLHTRWAAATVDLYCPITSHRLQQLFFSDPRINPAVTYADHPSRLEQLQEIREAGGAAAIGPAYAPRYPEFKQRNQQLRLL